MASCDLVIALDGSAEVTPGTPLTGRVIARPSESVEARALTIQYALISRIDDSSQTVVAPSVALFSGSWEPGEHVYSFSLTAPALPFEYMGEHASFFWRLVARADVPWSIDPEATHEIKLKPAAETRWKLKPDATGDREAALERPKSSAVRSPVGCVVACIVALIAAIGLFAATLVLDFEDEKGATALSALVFCVAAGVLLLLWWSRLSPAELAKSTQHERGAELVGTPQLAVELAAPTGYRQAPDGEAITCTVWVKPEAPLLEAHATLEAEVSWVEPVPGSDPARTRRVSRSLYSASSELLATSPGEYRGRVALPAVGAVPTPLEVPNGAVRWRVRCALRSTELGWSGSQTLSVTPRPDPGPGFESEGVVA